MNTFLCFYVNSVCFHDDTAITTDMKAAFSLHSRTVENGKDEFGEVKIRETGFWTQLDRSGPQFNLRVPRIKISVLFH